MVIKHNNFFHFISTNPLISAIIAGIIADIVLARILPPKPSRMEPSLEPSSPENFVVPIQELPIENNGVNTDVLPPKLMLTELNVFIKVKIP
ncbi:hypothetical protein AGMMS50268_12890 [Spirochaetia bacterium]|nr:hypothetical protein AGMMS50268_12890 [Spirochaetia bacterium]